MSQALYHPVIHLPAGYEIYDFTQGYDPNRSLQSPFGVGRYNEKRPGMYESDLFTSSRRDIHVGIDIGAPIGTPVHAFEEGEVFLFACNSAPGDYGYTLITRHLVQNETLFALHGHLSAKSVDGKAPGQQIRRGEVIAWIGDKQENGGWNPHLHFQLSRVEPLVCDMPGVVSEEQLEDALRIYPDPRLVLGRLY
jgi:peptidoglycan LD-endopeptidase LytH